MKNNKTIVKSGTSLSTLLLVLFIAFKLSGVINWSWVWILSPVWIPLSVALIMIIIILIYAMIKDKKYD